MLSLLSPAGDYECLKAAVYAGADEVYFGLQEFNARKNAKNFTFEEAKEAIRFCRIRNVKTNVTLNTLLYGREYENVCKMVEKLENECPPDAYIVQDTGLAYCLSSKFRGIPLHASTQMQIHGSYCAEMFKELGFTRIVLAREMSKDDIKAFAKTGIETEVFVHGAMCVCRSGGCLMSSMIGKRSGNRGECAYPCRLSYNNCHPLSLKDLCLAKHIPELAEIGVSALKLEGRMKSAEYVYEVTKIYRRLIDENRAADKNEMTRLENIFSRSGFTDGYFTSKIGKAMFGIRTDCDKEKTRDIKTVIAPTAIPVKMRFFGKVGSEAVLELSSSEASVKAVGGIVEQALNLPTSDADIKKQLSKLGNTDFYAQDIEIISCSDGFYPASFLNSLRRSAVKMLEDALYELHKRASAEIFNDPSCEQSVLPHTVAIRFEGKYFSEKAIKTADIVEIPLVNHNMWKTMCDKSKLSLVLPSFIFENDVENIKSLLSEASSHGITMLTLPNLSFLPLCKGFRLRAGYEMNCISSQTALFLEKMGFESICASPESKGSDWKNAEVFVYGKVRLMSTRNCMMINYGKCTCGNGGILSDRTGASFPVFCESNHTNAIYNSVPLWLLDKTIDKSKFILFTTENEKEQEKVITSLLNHSSPFGKFTRGYR